MDVDIEDVLQVFSGDGNVESDEDKSSNSSKDVNKGVQDGLQVDCVWAEDVFKYHTVQVSF